MSKFTQKYTIIALLDDQAEGYEYASSNWPLHVTIADVFAISGDINKLIENLFTLVKNQPAVSAVASHDELFGRHGQTSVTILDMSQELVSLHHTVVALLKDAGVTFKDPQYTEAGFKAHATVQTHARLKLGDTVVIDNLAIVDMFPDKDPTRRKILKIYSLAKSMNESRQV